MFNNFLTEKEAQQEIKRREQEAETYGLQKRLGYGDTKLTHWILLVILLIIISVLLF